MKNVQKHHNHVIEQVPPDYYQVGVEKNILQRIWHMNKLHTILGFIDFPAKTILDVGSASGWFISKIQEKFPKTKCYGIDIYDKAIIHGKKLYPKIAFAVADARKMPFKNESFDVVVCTEVLEHVDDPKSVLLEIKRVLRKDGVGVIELDSGSWLFSLSWFLWRKFHGKVWKDAHVHSFNSKKLERIIDSCGFDIIAKKKFNLGMAMAFSIKRKNEA